MREIEAPIWVRDESWVRNGAGKESRGAKRLRTRHLKCPSFLQRAVEWIGFTDGRIGLSQPMHTQTGMRLNLTALTHAQLETSALNAGAPLDTLLPYDFIPAIEETDAHNMDTNVELNSSSPFQAPLTPRLGGVVRPAQAHAHAYTRSVGISALFTRIANVLFHKTATASGEHHDHVGPSSRWSQPAGNSVFSEETPNAVGAELPAANTVDGGLSHLHLQPPRTPSPDNLDLQTMQMTEKKRAFRWKMIIAWVLFFVFWTASDLVVPFPSHWLTRCLTRLALRFSWRRKGGHTGYRCTFVRSK